MPTSSDFEFGKGGSGKRKFLPHRILKLARYRRFMRGYTRAVSVLYVHSLVTDLRLRTPGARIFVLREPSGAFFDFSAGAFDASLGPNSLSQLKRKYLEDTLQDVERRLRRSLKDQGTNRGPSSITDAPADALHKTKRSGSLSDLSVEGSIFGRGTGSLSSRASGRNEPLKTSISVTTNRGVLTITGIGIVEDMMGGLIYVPEGGFAREDNKPFAMYKPETTDVIFRSRIYKKYGGRWIRRRGLLSKLFQNIGDVIGYGGQE